MRNTSSRLLVVAAITSLMIFNYPSLAFKVSRLMKFRTVGRKFESLMPLRGRSDDVGSGKKEKYSKSNLPTKICCVCHRPYSWRKKWEKVWEEVKYCSERCRRNRSSGTANTQPENVKSIQGIPNVKSAQEWNKKSAINIAQTLVFLGATELSRLTPAIAQSSPRELLDVFEGIDWNDEIDLNRKSNFRRLDETPDSLFYSKPRFTEHIDAPAVAALVIFQQQQLIQLARRLEGPGGRPCDLDLLDLCASHVSHLPTTDFPPRSRPPILLPSTTTTNNNTITDCSQYMIDLKSPQGGSGDETTGTGRIVVGLGMNAEELQRNQQLTHGVTHDLNACPSLPFGDAQFDAVLLQLSVDYLTRPLEVMREVGRVLRVGGVVIISFSNRVFIDKAVAAWTGKDDREHITTVGAYIHFAGGFEDPPRAFDLSPGRGSDPLFAVVGCKKPL